MTTKPIEIDLEELMMAMQHHGYEVEWFLDLENGEVVPRFDDGIAENDPETLELIETDPARYRKIESIGSGRSFQLMEDFVGTLPEGLASTAPRRSPAASQAVSRLQGCALPVWPPAG